MRPSAPPSHHLFIKPCPNRAASGSGAYDPCQHSACPPRLTSSPAPRRPLLTVVGHELHRHVRLGHALRRPRRVVMQHHGQLRRAAACPRHHTLRCLVSAPRPALLSSCTRASLMYTSPVRTNQGRRPHHLRADVRLHRRVEHQHLRTSLSLLCTTAPPRAAPLTRRAAPGSTTKT